MRKRLEKTQILNMCEGEGEDLRTNRSPEFPCFIDRGLFSE